MAIDTQAGMTTLVGVFEDFGAAERASHQLMEHGIDRSSIQIQSNFRTSSAGSTAEGTGDAQHEGGFMGWWHRLVGEDDENVRHEGGHYAEAVRRGSAVLTVRTSSDMVDRAAEIMNSAGAVDVDDRVAGWQESGYKSHDPEAEPYTYDQAGSERERNTYDQAGSERERIRGNSEGGTIPVVEEEIQVGKRAVKRGGVRVYSRMVNRPHNEQISLREERVKVERRPVDRPISDAEINALRDQSIEVTETVEEPVIGKRARVREEVIVGKETTERTQQVQETLRHTEVKVDRIGDGPAGDYESGRYQTGGAADYDANAYAYGTRLGADAAYRNRNWDDIESDVRSDYERTNAGTAWEKVKASVRRGWDEATGRR